MLLTLDRILSILLIFFKEAEHSEGQPGLVLTSMPRLFLEVNSSRERSAFCDLSKTPLLCLLNVNNVSELSRLWPPGFDKP